MPTKKEVNKCQLAIIVITAIMMFCNDGIKTLHEFKETLGDGGGQSSLACCIQWGCKEADSATEKQQTETQGELLLNKSLSIRIQTGPPGP